MILPNPLPPKGLIALRMLGGLFRRRLVNLAGRSIGVPQLLDRSRAIVFRFDGLFQNLYRESLLYSWLKAGWRLARGLPIIGGAVDLFQRGPSFVHWPQIEAAATDLMSRNAMTLGDYMALEIEAKQTAFTVARVQSVNTLKTIQQTLTNHVIRGGTLRQFRRELAENVEGVLSPARLEGVYRDNMGVFAASGQRRILTEPGVGDEFPYVLYTAIHDSRVRVNHKALEKLGIGGTAVYRRNDPVIQEFWPPWDFQCRCHTIPLSIEDAARHGCIEAKRWLESGIEPSPPAFVKHPGFHPSAAWLAEHPLRIAA